MYITCVHYKQNEQAEDDLRACYKTRNGNREMKRNKTKLISSVVMDIRYNIRSLNNNSAYFPYHRCAREIKLNRKTRDAQTCNLP